MKTYKEIIDLMCQAGLINNGRIIKFSEFKKLADIHTYIGNRQKKYIIIFRNSSDNIFGFYPLEKNKQNSIKWAYDIFVRFITNGESEMWLFDKSAGIPFIAWGNCGIPISYRILRTY